MTAITADQLTALVAQALINANTSPSNAECVARALVAADIDGLSSHGVSRLPSYADQANSGKVDGQVQPQVDVVTPAIVKVDARCGFAFPAIEAGMSAALRCLPQSGVVAMAVGNSHHFGVAGSHVERAAEQGAVALAFGNSPAALAPWGGSRAVFGTNPIAFATPRRDAPPLVTDLSLSKVARGKVMVAKNRGEAIPGDWALDADGRPTTNPADVLAGGTMLPMGDAKGAVLALVVEILAAALTGSSFGFEASSFFAAEGDPPRVGQFFLFFDPERMAGPGYGVRLETLLTAITDQDGTRLPGERRLENRARHQAEGLDLPQALLEDIRQRAGAA